MSYAPDGSFFAATCSEAASTTNLQSREPATARNCLASEEAPPTHDDSCREFIPVMLELLSAGQAANEAAQATEEQAQAIRDSVEEFLLYGMPKNELEDIMLKTFTEADKDGSGSLDRKVRALAVPVETTSVTTSVWEVLWEIFGFGKRSA